MEAITIAGIAVVAVGGYFTVLDFLGDLGITGRMASHQEKESYSKRNWLPQRHKERRFCS